MKCRGDLLLALVVKMNVDIRFAAQLMPEVLIRKLRLSGRKTSTELGLSLATALGFI
jgi:hypothetical protein